MLAIFCDWKSNQGNIKGRLILASFRIVSLAKQNRLVFILWIPFLILYRVIFEWILGVEIPYKTTVGQGLTLYHGQALVINDGVILGKNCIIRHCTTIGNKQMADGSYSKCPVIGNNVDIGANVCIIGPIMIGDNVKIGAGSVVTKNIPSNSIVVGNPARIL